MAEKNRKAKAGGPRTEVFAMRLDPKLKYLAEIAARKQRRSLANFIEWSMEQALGTVKLVESEDGLQNRSVLDEANRLWDLEPSYRLIKLAENYPDLLNYEEQLIWKAIFEVGTCETYKDAEGNMDVLPIYFVDGKGLNKTADFARVKYCWAELVGYAEGAVSIEELQVALQKSVPF
jgi:hypothetical protein